MGFERSAERDFTARYFEQINYIFEELKKVSDVDEKILFKRAELIFWELQRI